MGCSDPYHDFNQIQDGPLANGARFVDKSRLGQASSYVGDACSMGCIWSSYAIDLGAQSPTHDCAGTRCACVEFGNIYSTCVADVDSGGQSSPDSDPMTWFEDVDDNQPRVGDQCSVGCLWSAYAVSVGAQLPQDTCDIGACACVLQGNVWFDCQPSEPVGAWGEEDSQPAPASAPPQAQPQSQPDSNSIPSSGRSHVPYFCQYRNQLQGWATCQNTSIAMILAKYGWRGVPDDITRTYGRFTAQSPGGLANVFNLMASDAGLSVRATPETNGSLPELRAELAAGRPVIIHGYFTAGHVIVVTGFDSNGYYVNDPAGRWNEVFMGGYPSECSGTEGHGLYYSKAAFETAVSRAEDGYTQLPLWFHTFR